MSKASLALLGGRQNTPKEEHSLFITVCDKLAKTFETPDEALRFLESTEGIDLLHSGNCELHVTLGGEGNIISLNSEVPSLRYLPSYTDQMMKWSIKYRVNIPEQYFIYGKSLPLKSLLAKAIEKKGKLYNSSFESYYANDISLLDNALSKAGYLPNKLVSELLAIVDTGYIPEFDSAVRSLTSHVENDPTRNMYIREYNINTSYIVHDTFVEISMLHNSSGSYLTVSLPRK